MLTLSDAELQTIGHAFDKAWDTFLKTGLLTRHNLGESQQMLATRILRATRRNNRSIQPRAGPR